MKAENCGNYSNLGKDFYNIPTTIKINNDLFKKIYFIQNQEIKIYI